jgi:hypothetical protein
VLIASYADSRRRKHDHAVTIPGSFCQPQASLQNTAGDIAPKSMRSLPNAELILRRATDARRRVPTHDFVGVLSRDHLFSIIWIWRNWKHVGSHGHKPLLYGSGTRDLTLNFKLVEILKIGRRSDARPDVDCRRWPDAVAWINKTMSEEWSFTWRQPIRGFIYPHVLNRQRRAARQLLIDVDNARAVLLTRHISNLGSTNNTLS